MPIPEENSQSIFFPLILGKLANNPLCFISFKEHPVRRRQKYFIARYQVQERDEI